MMKAAEQRGGGYIQSAHKSLESFKFIYMPPTQGCIRTDQRIESVGDFKRNARRFARRITRFRRKYARVG